MAMTTTLLDLITAGLLQSGSKVMVRDVEGELTSQGTIISHTDRGTIEYKTPTAFSKAVTNSTSGGWQQVKLKSSGGTTSLFDIKRKYAGYSNKKRKMQKREHHTSGIIHSDHFPGDEHAIKVGLNNISLPILVRFRDDDTKRGKINRVSEDFSTFELEYKGKTYKSVSSASKEMYREYAEETGDVVSINSNGFEDLKYQTPSGEWSKLRELFPVEIRKKYVNISQPITYTTSSESSRYRHDDDEDYEDDVMSNASDSDSPHSPSSSPPSPSHHHRSTTITKHIKHSLSDSPSGSSPSSHPIHPIKTPTKSSSSAPIILSLKSPTPPVTRSSRQQQQQQQQQQQHHHHHHHHNQHHQHGKEVELLVHIESSESIPYEVICTADSYDALRARLADSIPDFPFHLAHEIGIYSEYWEKHAGIAYIKPPRNWADFPQCTTVLLKKIPEQILISQFDI